MIYTLLAASFSLLLTSAACKKIPAQLNTTLTGNWKFTEQLQDPGDGSGTWKPVTNTAGYIKFKADSSMESNVVYVEGFNRYSVANDKITFSISGTSTSYTYHYQLANNELTIYPNCIEKCGLRFKRLQ